MGCHPFLELRNFREKMLFYEFDISENGISKAGASSELYARDASLSLRRMNYQIRLIINLTCTVRHRSNQFKGITRKLKGMKFLFFIGVLFDCNLNFQRKKLISWFRAEFRCEHFHSDTQD